MPTFFKIFCAKISAPSYWTPSGSLVELADFDHVSCQRLRSGYCFCQCLRSCNNWLSFAWGRVDIFAMNRELIASLSRVCRGNVPGGGDHSRKPSNIPRGWDPSSQKFTISPFTKRTPEKNFPLAGRKFWRGPLQVLGKNRGRTAPPRQKARKHLGRHKCMIFPNPMFPYRETPYREKIKI